MTDFKSEVRDKLSHTFFARPYENLTGADKRDTDLTLSSLLVLIEKNFPKEKCKIIWNLEKQFKCDTCSSRNYCKDKFFNQCLLEIQQGMGIIGRKKNG